jgi:hypothetical protein
MVKLQIIGNQRSQLLDIARVVSIEQLLVQSRNRLRQLLLALDTAKRRNRLTMDRNKRTRHQDHQQQSTKLFHRNSSSA